MPCDLLRLNIVLREDQKSEQPATSKLYDIYAYCEGDAHQLGSFECLINRDDILDRFKELLPNISLSSLGRGPSQEAIFDKDISLVDAFGETTALGKEIFSAMPLIIRESISNSNNIRLFTNDILLPWEIMHNENGFVSLSIPFGISPATKRRITPRPRKINERLRILMIVDPLDNLPQATKSNQEQKCHRGGKGEFHGIKAYPILRCYGSPDITSSKPSHSFILIPYSFNFLIGHKIDYNLVYSYFCFVFIYLSYSTAFS